LVLAFKVNAEGWIVLLFTHMRMHRDRTWLSEQLLFLYLALTIPSSLAVPEFPASTAAMTIAIISSVAIFASVRTKLTA
jgi:hypothetical protein